MLCSLTTDTLNLWWKSNHREKKKKKRIKNGIFHLMTFIFNWLFCIGAYRSEEFIDSSFTFPSLNEPCEYTEEKNLHWKIELYRQDDYRPHTVDKRQKHKAFVWKLNRCVNTGLCSSQWVSLLSSFHWK